jgi:formate-dependent nitrite reductase cytochrome c552 subunit
MSREPAAMKITDRRRRGGRAPLPRFAAVLFVLVTAAVFCIAATVSAAAGPRWRACLSCHENPELFLTTAKGERLSLVVAAADLGGSAHRGLECRGCHPGVNTGPPRRAPVASVIRPSA